MVDHLETGWDSFFFWAKQFRDMPTFDAEERDYKASAAAQVAVARRAFLDEADWVPELLASFALQENNLVTHFAWRPFLQWVEADLPEARAALGALWEDGDADAPSRLNAFSARVPDSTVAGRGVRLNVAAYLLGGIDHLRWPNYRVTVLDRACELAKVAKATREMSIGGAYGHALAFFDQLSLEAKRFDVDVRDRLDAQSLAFCVTLWKAKPAAFSQDAWDGLAEFRSVPSSQRRAASRASTRVVRPLIAPNTSPCPMCGHEDNVTRVGTAGEGRWEFSCSWGPHHSEPLSFTVAGR